MTTQNRLIRAALCFGLLILLSQSGHAGTRVKASDGPPPAHRGGWVKVQPEISMLEGHKGRFHGVGFDGATYDAQRGEVLIYKSYVDGGKRCGSIYSRAIYGYDAEANRLQQRTLHNWQTPTCGKNDTCPLPENDEAPTPGDRHPYGNFAWADGAVYLYGGANKSLQENCGQRSGHPKDTWKLDLESGKWTDLGNAKPGVVLEGCMGYDPEADLLVMSTNGKRGWAMKTGDSKPNWTPVKQSIPHNGCRIAWDSKRKQLVRFGGGPPGRGGGNDLARFDSGSMSWKRIKPEGEIPGARRFHGFDYDRENDLFVMFGGKGKKPWDDTWTYDPESNRWARLELPASPGRSPFVAMAYDPKSGAFFMSRGSAKKYDFWLYRHGDGSHTGEGDSDSQP